MSQGPPIEFPKQWQVFWEWGNRGFVIPIILLLTEVALLFFGSQIGVPPLLSLIVLILLLAFLPVAYLIFYITIWRQRITIVAWFGICREENTKRNIILFQDEVTILSVILEFGAAVKSWGIRFNAPDCCMIVDCHKPREWTSKIYRRKGIACQSGWKLGNQIHLAFHIQAKGYDYYEPNVRLSLDISTNLQDFPDSQSSCEQQEYANREEFDAVIVPNEVL